MIVEKPFGRDSESSAELGRGLGKHLTEEQVGLYVFVMVSYLPSESLMSPVVCVCVCV